MYLKHILKALAQVCGFIGAVALFLAWIGLVVYLYTLWNWWSCALAAVLSLLTLAVPIGTMNYLDERTTRELRAKMDELIYERSHRDA